MFRLTLKQAQEKLKKKEVSVTELVQSFFQRIKNVDGDIKAYLSLHENSALARAKELDQVRNFFNPLTGIPFANKSLICIQGEESNAASKILQGFKPIENATVIEKLLDKNAISLGNVNMDEFAQGSSTENSGFNCTHNPWDLKKVPGGSSGGSAAAVAADECIFALGTDTGGSIRQPAAFCGCVGLKVTYGRVSRSGVMAYGSSFDTIGCLTKTVEDAALVLEGIAGYDPKDFTTVKKEVPSYAKNLNLDLKGIKIAYLKEFMEADSLDPKIKESTLKTMKILEKEGCILEEISIPELKYAIAVYYLLVKSEASTNLHRYDGIRYGHSSNKAVSLEEIYTKSRTEGFGDEIKRCIMLGTYALSAGYYDAYYLKAAKVRRLIKQAFDQVFEKYSAIFAPVSPFLPFNIGEKSNDPLSMYLADIYTVPMNLAGIPAISIPIDIIDGLPVGAQIIGKQFSEEKILQIAHKLEQLISFSRLKY